MQHLWSQSNMTRVHVDSVLPYIYIYIHIYLSFGKKKVYLCLVCCPHLFIFFRSICWQRRFTASAVKIFFFCRRQREIIFFEVLCVISCWVYTSVCAPYCTVVLNHWPLPPSLTRPQNSTPSARRSHPPNTSQDQQGVVYITHQERTYKSITCFL